jgi:iron-sulfur cluster assembly accessory protein
MAALQVIDSRQVVEERHQCPYLSRYGKRRRGCFSAALLENIMTQTRLSMTDQAAARVQSILAKEPDGSALRISVNGGGCSGFSYVFDVSTTAAQDDIIVEHKGARIVVDEMSLGYMEGAVVDFVDDLMGQSFRINNPMATAGCGCGTSFSI